MSDDEEIVLFALELEDDGFEAYGEVVVGLFGELVANQLGSDGNGA